MNPIVLAARIGTMAVLFLAFVTSAMSNFMRATYAPDVDYLNRLVIGQSAWSGRGRAGCAMIVVGLLLTVVALIVSAYAPGAAKVIDFATSAIVVLTGLGFVVFVHTYGPQVDLGFTYELGSTGIVTLFLLLVAAVLAAVAGVFTRNEPRMGVSGPIPQEPFATR